MLLSAEIPESAFFTPACLPDVLIVSFFRCLEPDCGEAGQVSYVIENRDLPI